jgi:prepilin-type N-terminal cleavage/methylation domain-containing protein
MNGAMVSLRQQEYGVTLIELLVTLVVIGVVSALSIPRIGEWIEKGRLVSDLDRLTSRLVLLRQRAIVEGRAYRLHHQEGQLLSTAYDGGVTVDCVDTLNPGTTHWIDLSTQPDAPSGVPAYVRSLPIELEVGAIDNCNGSGGSGLCLYPQYGICFDGSGRASADGGLVELESAEGTDYRLQIFETGYLEKSRRREESGAWLIY